ncbi:DNA alkylation repair protein [Roseimaritima sediminicola]|uniref:DNA alkylation repair protein n=1 Tax=Roseimaritima sediminicola TaxID=2662066 RepID=UPI0012982C1C|nr:DNA alkylation repair protein [Roseimaritima sediminicola]
MSMTKTQVIALLRENADPRGITHWNKRASGLKSFGIGLTRLRKLAKQVGRDHRLAQSLWKSDIYDAKVLSLLVDDPKQMTPQQVEAQVDDGLGEGMLVHVFASCDATLAKTRFAFELARGWIDSDDPLRRQCGYSLLYELSKKNPKGMDDAYLLAQIERIEQTIAQQPMWVREAMGTALMGIGKRNPTLNKAALKAARRIGPLDVDYGDDNRCEPLDIVKHLTSDHLKVKWARQGQ